MSTSSPLMRRQVLRVLQVTARQWSLDIEPLASPPGGQERPISPPPAAHPLSPPPSPPPLHWTAFFAV